MKYNLITDLSSTHFGSYQLNDYDHSSLREIDYKDCLFFEASQVFDKDFEPPSSVSAIKYIHSKCYRPYELFEYPYLFLPFKGKLLCHTVHSTTVSAEEISTERVDSKVINTNILLALEGKIDAISATSITAGYDREHDGIATELGIIDNLRGDEIHYSNAKFDTITVTGTAELSAKSVKWADIAELYYGENKYEPGTLVEFGGQDELTLATNSVNGCVSENPGILLNAAIRKSVNSIPLLLTGKTKVKINGPIEKFDRIELSDIPGVARKQSNGKVIGIALDSNDFVSTKLVECILKLMIE